MTRSSADRNALGIAVGTFPETSNMPRICATRPHTAFLVVGNYIIAIAQFARYYFSILGLLSSGYFC
jgi:hypothetical protein